MNIGLIGAGSIGAIHARSYAELGVRLTAVADPREEAVKARPELFEGVRYYADYRDLVADPEIEAVDICLINSLHAEVIREAMRHGKHIFCEKTMTDNATDSRDLCQRLKAYPQNFQVGYMKRFFPATEKAKELLPEIGDILTTYVRSYQAFEWKSDPYDQVDWKPRGKDVSLVRQFASAGMLNMAGSHMIDVMNLLVGEVKTVYATNWTPPGYDVEVTSNALMHMSGGSTVHFEAALSPYSRAGLRQDGWDEKIEINGRRGKLEILYVIWDQPAHYAPLLRFYSEEQKTHTDYTFPKVNAFTRELEAFLENCRAGRRSVPGAQEGLAVDLVIDACYRSAATRSLVELSA
ncbi:hypothetical protein BH09VER1_BH09VER1_47220 [soil metagenome]